MRTKKGMLTYDWVDFYKEFASELLGYKDKRDEKIKLQRDQKGSALADNDVDTAHYWMYSPGDNACMWDEFRENSIMVIGLGEIGDLSQYSSKEEMKVALQEKVDAEKTLKQVAYATWQFANEKK